MRNHTSTNLAVRITSMDDLIGEPGDPAIYTFAFGAGGTGAWTSTYAAEGDTIMAVCFDRILTL